MLTICIYTLIVFIIFPIRARYETCSAELKAVAVAGVSAVAQISVAVSDTVFDCYNADRACLYLSVQIPAVVRVVISDTAVKHIARTASKFRRESVGVFIAVVGVIVRGAINHLIISGPFVNGFGGHAAYLYAGIAVVIGIDFYNLIIASGNLNAFLRA